MNEEINLVVCDRALAGRLGKIFGEDLQHSRRVDAEGWRARSLWQRLRELLSVPVRKEL